MLQCIPRRRVDPANHPCYTTLRKLERDDLRWDRGGKTGVALASAWRYRNCSCSLLPASHRASSSASRCRSSLNLLVGVTHFDTMAHGRDLYDPCDVRIDCMYGRASSRPRVSLLVKGEQDGEICFRSLCPPSHPPSHGRPQHQKSAN